MNEPSKEAVEAAESLARQIDDGSCLDEFGSADVAKIAASFDAALAQHDAEYVKPALDCLESLREEFAHQVMQFDDGDIEACDYISATLARYPQTKQ